MKKAKVELSMCDDDLMTGMMTAEYCTSTVRVLYVNDERWDEIRKYEFGTTNSTSNQNYVQCELWSNKYIQYNTIQYTRVD